MSRLVVAIVGGATIACASALAQTPPVTRPVRAPLTYARGGGAVQTPYRVIVGPYRPDPGSTLRPSGTPSGDQGMRLPPAPLAPSVARALRVSSPDGPWPETVAVMRQGPCLGGCGVGRVGTSPPVPVTGGLVSGQSAQCPTCAAIGTVVRGPGFVRSGVSGSRAPLVSGARLTAQESRAAAVTARDSLAAMGAPTSATLSPTGATAFGVPVPVLAPAPARDGFRPVFRSVTPHPRPWTFRLPNPGPAPGARIEPLAWSRAPFRSPSGGDVASMSFEPGPLGPDGVRAEGVPGTYGRNPGLRGEGSGLPAPASQAESYRSRESVLRPFRYDPNDHRRPDRTPLEVPHVPRVAPDGRYAPPPAMPRPPRGSATCSDGEAHVTAPALRHRGAGSFAGKATCQRCGVEFWVRRIAVESRVEPPPIGGSQPPPRSAPPSLGQEPQSVSAEHPDALWRHSTVPRR